MNRLLLRLVAILILGLASRSTSDALTTKTFVVTSVSNVGSAVPGTLTWAVYQANYNGGDINYIHFNIPGLVSETEIVLAETLFIGRPTIIDGTTQPGYSGQPIIRINCAALGTGFNIVGPGGGLPGGGGSTIQGFRIVNFRGNAINLSAGAAGNTIAANQIGFQPLVAGGYLRNATAAPQSQGITVLSGSNVLRRNTISGVTTAISISSSGNTVEGNFIGTDPAGATKIGNDAAGLVLGAGAQENLIGPGNIVSGNATNGVTLFGGTATGNRIFGNMIGVNAAGTGVVSNGSIGVLIANGASANWVGGPYGGVYAGNVISGNADGGVVIGTAGSPVSSGNRVESNFIGCDAAGATAIGSQVSGVIIQDGSSANVVRKNVIVGHVNHGIAFVTGATNNAAYGNWIGLTDKSQPMGNGSFGIYISDSSNNTAQISAANAGVGTEQNVFGSNGNGPVGVYGSSVGNIVELTAAPSKTFVVTSADGSRSTVGSLTWAIYQANYQGGEINYINFAIPAAQGETEIRLTEQLYIARPTVINAFTQSSDPSYKGVPLIRINCNGLESCFTIVAAGSGLPGGGGSTIQGFRMTNYSSNAVTILKGANGNSVLNNQMGFTPLPVPRSYLLNVTLFSLSRGIGIQSNDNIIRGNTISGVNNGIVMGEDVDNPGTITGATFSGNVIEQNFIGTDPTGMWEIGNDSDGIFFGAGCQRNLIGPGNVISGMRSTGVEFLYPTVTENRIFGNLIGLNAAGTDVIGNGELGVMIANGAANNWIGGPYGGQQAGNIISGNKLGGVAIGDGEWPAFGGSNNNHVEGNFIGTDGSKSKAIGVQISGVTVQTNSAGTVIRRNVVVGHVNHGIVFASGANNNALYGNWIGVNDKGASIANLAFGVYLIDASNNTIQVPAAEAAPGREQNIFGANSAGLVGVYGSSVGNIIDLSPPAPTPTPGPTATPAATPSRLLNISTRMRVETGDNALIAGFIITGSSPKKVIVRGLGPSLDGVDGALADPTLELNGTASPVSNDNWGEAPNKQQIIDTGIAPKKEFESAILATLEPGAYTAVMRGNNNTSGIGLVELYDLDSSGVALLANISTRGFVRSGDDVMIAGAIVGAGDGASRVLVRALGPSLGALGVTNPLPDPTLRLIDGNGEVIRAVDNWEDDGAQASELRAIGIAPSNPLEAALVAPLAPGAYTAIVADRNGNTGNALVEVYHIR